MWLTFIDIDNDPLTGEELVVPANYRKEFGSDIEFNLGSLHSEAFEVDTASHEYWGVDYVSGDAIHSTEPNSTNFEFSDTSDTLTFIISIEDIDPDAKILIYARHYDREVYLEDYLELVPSN